MFPETIKQIPIEGKIWGSALDANSNCLFLEARTDESEELNLVRIDLGSYNLSVENLKLSWWNKLACAALNKLYFVAYNDQQDPSNHSFFYIDLKSGDRSSLEFLPQMESDAHFPEIYEHGSTFWKTVADFLSLELPLSCEYFEWKNKIIISYYLRSGNGFDRYLLLLNEGEKEWKICQDQQMRGFAPGAFFVFDNQLIFIKDRNEVCVYPG